MCSEQNILEWFFIFHAYETIIPEIPKTTKNNFGILKNVEVQEEKCRDAGRNTHIDIF